MQTEFPLFAQEIQRNQGGFNQVNFSSHKNITNLSPSLEINLRNDGTSSLNDILRKSKSLNVLDRENTPREYVSSQGDLRTHEEKLQSALKLAGEILKKSNTYKSDNTQDSGFQGQATSNDQTDSPKEKTRSISVEEILEEIKKKNNKQSCIVNNLVHCQAQQESQNNEKSLIENSSFLPFDSHHQPTNTQQQQRGQTFISQVIPRQNYHSQKITSLSLAPVTFSTHQNYYSSSPQNSSDQNGQQGFIQIQSSLKPAVLPLLNNHQLETSFHSVDNSDVSNKSINRSVSLALYAPLTAELASPANSRERQASCNLPSRQNDDIRSSHITVKSENYKSENEQANKLMTLSSGPSFNYKVKDLSNFQQQKDIVQSKVIFNHNDLFQNKVYEEKILPQLNKLPQKEAEQPKQVNQNQQNYSQYLSSIAPQQSTAPQQQNFSYDSSELLKFTPATKSQSRGLNQEVLFASFAADPSSSSLQEEQSQKDFQFRNQSNIQNFGVLLQSEVNIPCSQLAEKSESLEPSSQKQMQQEFVSSQIKNQQIKSQEAEGEQSPSFDYRGSFSLGGFSEITQNAYKNEPKDQVIHQQSSSLPSNFYKQQNQNEFQANCFNIPPNFEKQETFQCNQWQRLSFSVIDPKSQPEINEQKSMTMSLVGINKIASQNTPVQQTISFPTARFSESKQTTLPQEGILSTTKTSQFHHFPPYVEKKPKETSQFSEFQIKEQSISNSQIPQLITEQNQYITQEKVITQNKSYFDNNFSLPITPVLQPNTYVSPSRDSTPFRENLNGNVDLSNLNIISENTSQTYIANNSLPFHASNFSQSSKEIQPIDNSPSYNSYQQQNPYLMKQSINDHLPSIQQEISSQSGNTSPLQKQMQVSQSSHQSYNSTLPPASKISKTEENIPFPQYSNLKFEMEDIIKKEPNYKQISKYDSSIPLQMSLSQNYLPSKSQDPILNQRLNHSTYQEYNSNFASQPPTQSFSQQFQQIMQPSTTNNFSAYESKPLEFNGKAQINSDFVASYPKQDYLSSLSPLLTSNNFSSSISINNVQNPQLTQQTSYSIPSITDYKYSYEVTPQIMNKNNTSVAPQYDFISAPSYGSTPIMPNYSTTSNALNLIQPTYISSIGIAEDLFQNQQNKTNTPSYIGNYSSNLYNPSFNQGNITSQFPNTINAVDLGFGIPHSALYGNTTNYEQKERHESWIQPLSSHSHLISGAFSPQSTEILQNKIDMNIPNSYNYSNYNFTPNIYGESQFQMNDQKENKKKNKIQGVQINAVEIICNSIWKYVSNKRKQRQKKELVKFIHHCATIIQKMIRGYLERKSYSKFIQFRQSLKAIFSGWRTRKILKLPKLMKIAQEIQYLQEQKRKANLPKNKRDIQETLNQQKTSYREQITALSFGGRWIAQSKQMNKTPPRKLKVGQQRKQNPWDEVPITNKSGKKNEELNKWENAYPADVQLDESQKQFIENQKKQQIQIEQKNEVLPIKLKNDWDEVPVGGHSKKEGDLMNDDLEGKDIVRKSKSPQQKIMAKKTKKGQNSELLESLQRRVKYDPRKQVEQDKLRSKSKIEEKQEQQDQRNNKNEVKNEGIEQIKKIRKSNSIKGKNQITLAERQSFKIQEQQKNKQAEEAKIIETSFNSQEVKQIEKSIDVSQDLDQLTNGKLDQSFLSSNNSGDNLNTSEKQTIKEKQSESQSKQSERKVSQVREKSKDKADHSIESSKKNNLRNQSASLKKNNSKDQFENEEFKDMKNSQSQKKSESQDRKGSRQNSNLPRKNSQIEENKKLFLKKKKTEVVFEVLNWKSIKCKTDTGRQDLPDQKEFYSKTKQNQQSFKEKVPLIKHKGQTDNQELNYVDEDDPFWNKKIKKSQAAPVIPFCVYTSRSTSQINLIPKKSNQAPKQQYPIAPKVFTEYLPNKMQQKAIHQFSPTQPSMEIILSPSITNLNRQPSNPSIQDPTQIMRGSSKDSTSKNKGNHNKSQQQMGYNQFSPQDKKDEQIFNHQRGKKFQCREKQKISKCFKGEQIQKSGRVPNMAEIRQYQKENKLTSIQQHLQKEQNLLQQKSLLLQQSRSKYTPSSLQKQQEIWQSPIRKSETPKRSPRSTETNKKYEEEVKEIQAKKYNQQKSQHKQNFVFPNSFFKN